MKKVIYQDKIMKMQTNANESFCMSMCKNKIRIIILFFLIFPSCLMEGCDCSSSEHYSQNISSISQIKYFKTYENSFLQFANLSGYKPFYNYAQAFFEK